MNIANLLSRVTNLLGSPKSGAASADPTLSRLDFGILEVALMVAALDGTVRQDEIAAFERLAAQCRGANETSVREAFERALRRAGYVLLLVQSGRFSAEECVRAFVGEAVAAMPNGFTCGAPADVRRAFVVWLAMAMADGDYTGIEREAIESLKTCLTDVKSAKFCQNAAAWSAAYPSYNPTQASFSVAETIRRGVKLLPDGFLADAEAALAHVDANPSALADLLASA